MAIQIGFTYALYILPVLALIAYWRWYYYKKPLYNYSSLEIVSAAKSPVSRWQEAAIFFMHSAALVSICLALARLRTPDERTRLPVEGIDIMLVLDVSASMQSRDGHNNKSRIDVALEQALNFINKRPHDAIGLVIFANTVVSRVPLTQDKTMLNTVIKDLYLGVIDPYGTVLSKAILAAANRLKNSQAKSKIMIVLTDGQPSEYDSNPKVSIEIAQNLGIKIYTIGIGQVHNHPFYGPVTDLNIPLLKRFAQETSGQFFHARNADELEQIYGIIDQLEKTQHDTPVFARYYEYFIVFLSIALLCMLIKLIITSLVWLSL